MDTDPNNGMSASSMVLIDSVSETDSIQFDTIQDDIIEQLDSNADDSFNNDIDDNSDMSNDGQQLISDAAKKDMPSPSEKLADQQPVTTTVPKVLPTQIRINPSQLVLIQNNDGSSQQVKTGMKFPATGSVQLVKTATGNLIRLKNKNGNLVSATTTSSTTEGSSGSPTVTKAVSTTSPLNRIVVQKSATPTRVVIAGSPVTTKVGVVGGTTISSVPAGKAITVSQAQKMGINLDATKLKSVTLSSKNPIAIAPKPTQQQQQQQKIVIKPQQIQTSGQNKVILSQDQILKIASPNGNQMKGGHQVKAISVPGKGIQYVRVLNSSQVKTPSDGMQAVTIKSASGGVTKVNVQQGSSQQNKIFRIKGITQQSAQQTTQQPATTASEKTRISIGSSTGVQTLIRKLNPETKPGSSNKIFTIVKKEPNDVKQEKSTESSLLNNSKKVVVVSKKSIEPPVRNSGKFERQKIAITGDYDDEVEDEDVKPEILSIMRVPDEVYEDLKSSSEDLRKKACNCTKSQCLKLYCDCFANGEFCANCNCKDCLNNIENEEERQRAVRSCLDRNPYAFKPKIGKSKESEFGRHNKGCNCKRSGCLKNYCECYEAKIACTSICRCMGCRNVDGITMADRLSINEPSSSSSVLTSSFGRPIKRTFDQAELHGPSSSKSTYRTATGNEDMTGITTAKRPYNFLTHDVIEATVQCMIAQADECQRNGNPQGEAERMILEEFGRCLVEIIDFSIKNNE